MSHRRKRCTDPAHLEAVARVEAAGAARRLLTVAAGFTDTGFGDLAAILAPLDGPNGAGDGWGKLLELLAELDVRSPDDLRLLLRRTTLMALLTGCSWVSPDDETTWDDVAALPAMFDSPAVGTAPTPVPHANAKGT